MVETNQILERHEIIIISVLYLNEWAIWTYDNWKYEHLDQTPVLSQNYYVHDIVNRKRRKSILGRIIFILCEVN